MLRVYLYSVNSSRLRTCCWRAAAFHTSKNRPNETVRSLDKRSNGWKRRQETFRKKTEVLLEMLHRCFRNGIDARFVLFDSWFANDGLLANIVEIGYGVICRLKATKTRYTYQGKAWTLKELWHEVARHRLQVVPGWHLKAAVLNVNLPLSGTVRLVFVRWTKKRWHCFLCTEIDLEPEEILNYYARRWAIEVYFRDAKQMLALGQGQSECFDALIAWTSIVMIRYLLLVHITFVLDAVDRLGLIAQNPFQENVSGLVLALGKGLPGRQVLKPEADELLQGGDLREILFVEAKSI